MPSQGKTRRRRHKCLSLDCAAERLLQRSTNGTLILASSQHELSDFKDPIFLSKEMRTRLRWKRDLRERMVRIH